MAILLNSGYHESGFASVQEVERLGGEFGEVYNQEVARDTENDCDETFDLFGILVVYNEREDEKHTTKIHRHPDKLPSPSICMIPYARIPERAEAMLPIR